MIITLTRTWMAVAATLPRNAVHGRAAPRQDGRRSKRQGDKLLCGGAG